MAKGQPDYLSYLLCLWRVSGGGEPHDMGRKAIWRASLESTRTGERRGFASLDELFDFLREQTGERVWEMVKEQPGYISYLLRLWREGAAWRASLESTRTGELRAFASLDELFDFLRERTGMAQGHAEEMECKTN
ncbi:MAG: hypothetical protein JXA14_09880 [Anaerolineae bacterium]|jgi:hypothetical protein|nr:hypothetical protein [Anaerolineae bacterium]